MYHWNCVFVGLFYKNKEKFSFYHWALFITLIITPFQEIRYPVFIHAIVIVFKWRLKIFSAFSCVIYTSDFGLLLN